MFLECLANSWHSWASTKLAAVPLMDLTDCGCSAEFWRIVRSRIPRARLVCLTVQFRKWRHFYIQLNRRAPIYQSSAVPRSVEFYTRPSLISCLRARKTLISCLGARGNNFWGKNLFYAKQRVEHYEIPKQFVFFFLLFLRQWHSKTIICKPSGRA